MAFNKLNYESLRVIGVLLISFWILTFFEEFPYFGSFNFLWLCKISLLLIALACFTKDGRYLLVFFSVAAIPLILWILDFVIMLSGYKTIGITQFMLEYGQGRLQFFMNLLHLFLLPLALIVSKNIEFHKSAKKQIIFAGIIVAIFSYFFSNIKEDINCVHNLCYPYPLSMDAGIALILVIVYILICALIIEPFVRRNLKKINWKIVRNIAIVWIILSLFFAGIAIIKYLETPHYICESNKEVICERFYMDRGKMLPFLKFRISEIQESCTISWYMDGELYVKYNLNNEKSQFVYFPSFEYGTKIISSKIECYSST